MAACKDRLDRAGGRLRRVVWIPVLLLAAVGGSAFDERSGVPAWRRLRDDLRAANARIAALHGEIEALRGEAEALEGDAFAIERAIREDLGLARPGESVVRLDGARRGGRG
jgi:cell division protein FtsB